MNKVTGGNISTEKLIVIKEVTGEVTDAKKLGNELAESVLRSGGMDILIEIKKQLPVQ